MLTKFGLTENELTDYRQLMLMPETDENGFFDESIDVKITQLKRLRLRRLQEQRNEVKVVADEESSNGLDKIEN
jgi:hypothetical protein